jgi:uncharacterized protein (UPF0335 family)
LVREQTEKQADAEARQISEIQERDGMTERSESMNSERLTRSPQMEGTATLLRELVGRVRAIDAQSKELNRELREVYAMAKGHGLSVKALKAIARDPNAQGEAETVTAYLRAMGAPDIVVGRLRSESLDTILFGTTGFPSDSIDMQNFDIERGIGD